MNRIEKLIKEKCPNGVEYKKLKSCCQIETGRQNANASDVNGSYMFFTTAKEASKINTYRWDTEALLIAGNANVGNVKHYKGKFDAYQRTYVLTNFLSKINVRFLFHFLCSNLKTYLSNRKNDAAMTYIVLSTLENFSVPVPPVEVQEEIVKILDKFGKLEADLEAELEARRSQYEFWREKLFSTNNCEFKKIKDICNDVIVPMRDKPKVFDGKIPWCRIEDIEGNYFNTSKSNQFVSDETIKKMNLKVFPTGTVICSCSASIGTYAINTQPLVTNQTFIGLVCGTEVINKYLFYYMQTQTKKLLSISNSGTIPYISRKKFEDLLIPIPSLEEQQKIVNILDKFDKLVNDISEGLPAEIEARRKQYEYYRDKLLSFEELSFND